MSDPQTQTQAPPLQTEISAACHLIEVAHTLSIDNMSELETALDALRSEAHATAVSVISSIRREGQLELLRIDRRLRPTIYWFVRHVLHDADPDQTRLVVLREFADYPSFKIVDGEMVVEVAYPPEPDPDRIECAVCREQPSTYTWTPVVGKGSPPAVALPVCSVCAELIRSNQIPQFSIGTVTFAVLEGDLWGARRVTR